jgi:anti-anti-sigma factor
MAAYVIEQQNEQAFVRLSGDLTALFIPELQASLKTTLNNGTRALEFDLSNTAMLDSSGMGLLIATANSAAQGKCRMRVTNVRPEIFRLLESMRLTARLNVSGSAR